MLKSLTPTLALTLLCGSLALAQQPTPPAAPPAPAVQPPAQPPAAAPAPQQQAPCSSPEHKQFDFWVGEWELEGKTPVPGKPNEFTTGKHKNTVTKIMNGCVIQENFDDLNGYHGMSVSMYDPQARKWKQTWVDDGGAYLDLVGELKDGKMVLLRNTVNPKGIPVIQRMTFANIRPDSFDWTWEASRDEGKTWVPGWQIHYVRKK
jgi:Protein of unknown function (DUF1579)